MTQENASLCGNDCIEKLLFPKPRENRPGLSRIDYRIGTYWDFREALLRKLNRDTVLEQWTHREPDDPGIALLEGAAVLGDILTFYQDLYANEAYLRTAQWRESIADLLRLTGYLLSPGVGGSATFAVEIKNKGNTPVIIPAGFPIKAQVKGLKQTADFETLETFTAYPFLSKFNLYRRLFTPNFTRTTTEFYIFSPESETTPIELKKGDRLLIGTLDSAANPTRFLESETVIIDDVRQLHDRQLFKIKGALKTNWNDSTLYGFKLGRTFRHFGHNAPPEIAKINGNCASFLAKTTYKRRLYTNTSTTGYTVIEPALTTQEIPLDIEVQDLAVGSRFLIQGLFYGQLINKEFTLVRTVQDIKPLSMTWGGVSGETSLITINKHLSIIEGGKNYNVIDIRHIRFHEVLDPLLELRAGMKETTLRRGKKLYFQGTDKEVQCLKNRRLLFEKTGEKPFTAAVVSVESLSPAVSGQKLLRGIILDQNIDYSNFPNQNPVVRVYGNLIDADQGKTGIEVVLGSGDNREKFQSFKLPQSPLTYHNQPGETPPGVPGLTIYINDRLWERVASFFDHGPNEEIYIVREDNDGYSWAQFGDGKTGARLPSGIRNVKAVYRTGIGAYGELKENTNPQAGGKMEGLEKIHMPLPSSGGDQPESGDKAREAAPGKTQTLGRLVSLSDFESEALAVPGVSKAAVQWKVDEETSAVVLTLLMETGREAEFSTVETLLNQYNRERGPRRFPVKVVQGKRLYIYIVAEFALDPSFREDKVKTAIKEALGIMKVESSSDDAGDTGGLFSLKNREFGQRAYASQIEGTIQEVEGVVWAKVTALYPLGEADDPFTLDTTPPAQRLNKTAACDSQHILCLYEKHLYLSVSGEETSGINGN